MLLPCPDIEPLGDRAFTVIFASNDDASIASLVGGYGRALQGLPAIIDIVPAFNRICVHYDPLCLLAQGIDPLAWMHTFKHLPYTPLTSTTATHHRIPVCYDVCFALDLPELAQALNLPIERIVELHGSAEYRVAMTGFAPGFPYLTGLPELLRQPRRSNPRTRVEPGSVAVAENMCGIYPQALPGGWHIVGRSPLALFEATREPPCLLAAGDIVSFYPITRAQFEAWPC